MRKATEEIVPRYRNIHWHAGSLKLGVVLLFAGLQGTMHCVERASSLKR